MWCAARSKTWEGADSMAAIRQKDILNLLGGEILSVAGPDDFMLNGFSMLDDLRANTLTFIKKPDLALGHDFQSDVLYILPFSMKDRVGPSRAVYVADPRLSFIRCLNEFFVPPAPTGIHPTAIIGNNVCIGKDCSIGAYCVIADDCVLGDRCRLHPHVQLYSGVRIGNDVIVHGATVIGSDGFGYQRNPDGAFEKFPHFGGVVIGDDVEIGGQTCIDRGTLGDTIIGPRCKIDNLVHIAHNAFIGEDSAIIAHALIGGSVRLGKRCWIGPSASIINQVTLGDDVLVGIAANVIRDVTASDVVAGNPAKSLKKKVEV